MPQAYPRLIHPVQVTIEQIDREATFYDPDTREPIQEAARQTEITLPGQHRSRADPELNMISRGGDRPEQDGYVIFRKKDMDALGVQLQLNDRIIKVGHLTMSAYIERFEWIAQLQSYGGPTLLKAWYVDRAPSDMPEYYDAG